MSLKPAFHEDYIDTKASPLDAPSQDFDYDAADPDAEAEQTASQFDGAEFVRRVFDFCCHPIYKDGTPRSGPDVLQDTGRHLVALAWVVSPGYFEGSPSLTKLATRLGLHKQTLSRYTSAASREFGLVNRAGDHAWNRKPGTPKPAAVKEAA